MIYIKCFEKFEDDLGAITKKYGRSSYLSTSTKDRLKQLRIPIHKFVETYEKVELIKGFKEDKDLLDNLLISLKDHFYDYPIRFDDESSRYGDGYRLDLFYINPYIKVYNRFRGLWSSDNFNVYPARKSTEDLVVEIFNELRKGKQKKLDEPSSLRKGARDYGSRTRMIRSSEFERPDISVGLSFRLNYFYIGELSDFGWGDENYWEQRKKKDKIEEEILEYLKDHVIYRYFYMLGYKNIDFDIKRDNSASSSSFEIKINNI